MIKSKLYITLIALNERERQKFSEYVHAAFINKNKKVKKLCDILLNHCSRPSKVDLSKKLVYKKLFDGGDYRELKLNNIISDLFKLLQDFLAFQEYLSDPLIKQNLLAKSLIKREHYHGFNAITRRYQQLLENSLYSNYSSFHQQYKFHEIMDQFSLSGDKRSMSKGLQSQNDSLDLYYFANKLRIACDMQSRNMVINAGYQPHFLPELLERYKKEKQQYENIPAIQLYFLTLEMLTEQEEVHYFKLRKYLEEKSHIFPPNELNTVYSYALNYCVRKINSGRSSFYEEIFTLYKALLERDLLINNGFLSQWDYTNIITSAIRLQEFDWTDRFIHEYKTHLIPEEQFNVYTYNLTALYFAKKDYDKTLDLLHEVEFTDPFYHAAAKIIQLKIYFEIGETEALFSLAEAFRQFLKRNKQFSGYQKESNLNFIKAAIWIYKAKLNSDFGAKGKSDQVLKALWKKVLQLKPCANKVWLEEVALAG